MLTRKHIEDYVLAKNDIELIEAETRIELEAGTMHKADYSYFKIENLNKLKRDGSTTLETSGGDLFVFIYVKHAPHNLFPVSISLKAESLPIGVLDKLQAKYSGNIKTIKDFNMLLMSLQIALERYRR